MDNVIFIAVLAIVVLVIVVIAKTAVVVPQQSAFVVEQLGKYSRTLQAGFHILIPFVDRIAYRHTLKEQAIDIPEQICITRDNVQVGVDGVLYLQVLDARQASYGITNYIFAISQLAQTTLRCEIGKIELDRTFEERQVINAHVVAELDKASAPWGVKVLRYEIKNINPPHDVLAAMEKQMRAEREKRAVVLHLRGRARRQDQHGRGREAARDQGVGGVEAAADQRGRGSGRGDPGGRDGHRRGPAPASPRRCAPRAARDAMQLRIAEQYVEQFGELAKAGNTLVLPANLSDVGSMIALATKLVSGPDGESSRAGRP